MAFDFDGVVHKYSEGWKDGTIYDEINVDVVKEMQYLMDKGIGVIVLSTRDASQISEWFKGKKSEGIVDFDVKVVPEDIKFWNEKGVVGITNRKLPAMAYVDDRAIHFDGNIKEMQNNINSFLWKKTKKE